MSRNRAREGEQLPDVGRSRVSTEAVTLFLSEAMVESGLDTRVTAGMSGGRFELSLAVANSLWHAFRRRESRALADVDAPERRFSTLATLLDTTDVVAVRAYDRSLRREVVVWDWRLDAASEVGGHTLVSRAQRVAALVHPHVVAVYAVRLERGRLVVVTECIAGGELARWQTGVAPREIVAKYMQVGRGLAALHERGLVLGDFDDDSVVVSSEGVAKIVLFKLHTEQPLAYTATPVNDQYAFCHALWRAPRRSKAVELARVAGRQYSALGSPRDARKRLVESWLRETANARPHVDER